MVNMEDVAFFTEKSRRIVAEVKKDILGQKETVENTVIAILAGGNVLLEGVPGVGKTCWSGLWAGLWICPSDGSSLHPI